MVGNRLKGIVFIAMSEIILGVIFSYPIPFCLDSIQSEKTKLFNNNFSAGITLVQLTKSIILSTILIVSGFGLLKLKEWARKLTLIGIPFLLVYHYLTLTVFAAGSWSHDSDMGILAAVFYVIEAEMRAFVFYALRPLDGRFTEIWIILFYCVPIIVYLTRSKIKEKFKL